MPRRSDATSAHVDANAVVSYNLRAIRERNGWTQEQVAERLSRLTGRDVTQASISAMELVAEGRRRRRFDAQDLYVLSVIFDVPIVYFFLPPPDGDLDGDLADTDLPVASLYASFLGKASQLDAVDERLRQTRIGDPRDTVAGLRAVSGLRSGPNAWQEQYYAWRASRLHQWGADYGRQLGDIGGFLSFLGQAIREAAPEAYLSSGDYQVTHLPGGDTDQVARIRPQGDQDGP